MHSCFRRGLCVRRCLPHLVDARPGGLRGSCLNASRETGGNFVHQKTGRRAWNEHGNWRRLLYRLQNPEPAAFALGKAIADGLFFQFSELVEDLHVLAGLQKLGKIFEIGRCLSGIWLAA